MSHLCSGTVIVVCKWCGNQLISLMRSHYDLTLESVNCPYPLANLLCASVPQSVIHDLEGANGLGTCSSYYAML